MRALRCACNPATAGKAAQFSRGLCSFSRAGRRAWRRRFATRPGGALTPGPSPNAGQCWARGAAVAFGGAFLRCFKTIQMSPDGSTSRKPVKRFREWRMGWDAMYGHRGKPKVLPDTAGGFPQGSRRRGGDGGRMRPCAGLKCGTGAALTNEKPSCAGALQGRSRRRAMPPSRHDLEAAVAV